MSLFFKFSGKTFILNIQQNLQTQLNSLLNTFKVPSENLSFLYNGHIISNFQNIQKDSTIYANLKLKGGKGGFGAKLKNQGGKKIRQNDNMFSRDAQGRRIAYQQIQKNYTAFVKNKIVEEQQILKQRERFKVMQDTMKQGQSFMKLDKAYTEELQKTEQKLVDSIRIGRERHLQKMRLQMQKQKRAEQQQKEQKKQSDGQGEEKKEQRKIEQKVGNIEEKKEILEVQQLAKPIKKVKQEEPKSLSQVVKPLPASFQNSARDKLKSLFKK